MVVVLHSPMKPIPLFLPLCTTVTAKDIKEDRTIMEVVDLIRGVTYAQVSLSHSANTQFIRKIIL